MRELDAEHSLSEWDLIRRVAQSFSTAEARIETGIGDDAAVLRLDPGLPRRHILTTDTLVEGVHFDLRYMSLADVGYKALAANLSDVNAMGARSLCALGTLGVPPATAAADVELLLSGVQDAVQLAAEAGQPVSLIGGDTVAAPQWVIGFTVLGECDGPPLLRSGARVGDVLFHSGELGLSSAGLWELWESVGVTRASPETHLDPSTTGDARVAPTIQAHRRPQPPLALGPVLREAELATAAQDLSDSLSQCVLQLATASGVGVALDFTGYELDPELAAFAARLRQADDSYVVPAGMDPRGIEQRFSSLAALLLACAEDYELLFTVPADGAGALHGLPVAVRRIGRIVPLEHGCTYRDEFGVHELKPVGYEHL